MARKDYAKYFHQDFFDNPSPVQTSTNINIPIINKKKPVYQEPELNRASVELGFEERTQIKQDKDSLLFNQAPDFFEVNYQLQKLFWTSVLILALIPVFKSGLVNLFGLGQNFVKNIELRKIREKLKKDKKEIEAKAKNCLSTSGMKRTIKEEIKVIEQNEILIKIVQ